MTLENCITSFVLCPYWVIPFKSVWKRRLTNLEVRKMPIDFGAEYQTRRDENLMQLWVERSQLLPEAGAALETEITRRGLAGQAAAAKDIWAEDEDESSEGGKESDHRLAPAVAAWGPSIAYYWMRELHLRYRTKDGIPVQATVESTLLTRPAQGRGGGGRRAELRYSYDYQGLRTGRTVRDFTIGDKVGRALAFAHNSGETITVLVDPDDPDCSYFPSGFGWIQPLLYGVFFSLVALLLLAGVVVEVFTIITKH
jgi:Protein of unknown function (DUF3592)